MRAVVGAVEWCIVRTVFRHILVASDLTAQSAQALRLADGLASSFGSRIVVAHVLPMAPELRRWSNPEFRDDLRAYDLLLRRQLKAAEKALDRQVGAAGLASGRGVKCVARSGDAAPVLAKLVAELDADLVIVARGKGGKLGPVAERLVRIVGRAVLVAPVRGKGLAMLDVPARSQRRRARA